MTIHVVDIHQRSHHCPAFPDAHVYDTRRTILAVIDGGPCRNPQTIQCGSAKTTIPCGRTLPADRRCPACRVTVTEHSITVTAGPDMAAL